MTTKIKQLDSLAIVQIDLTIWSGQTKLNPEDIKLGIGGALPPERVAQLGSKKIIDTSRLKAFHAKRQAYRRTLGRIGMPFMSGYGVPVSKLEEVTQYLNNLEREFQAEKQSFLNDYDHAVEQWAMENPEMEQAIRACTLTREDVGKRISFDYQVFRISPLGDEDDRIEKKINGLGNDLIAELIDEAKKFHADNCMGKSSLNTRTHTTLAGWYEKLEGLAFLSSRIQPLANLVKEAMDVYQHAKGGRSLVAPYFWQVAGAVLILSDESKVDQYLQGKISLETTRQEAENDQVLSSDSLDFNAESGVPSSQLEHVSDTSQQLNQNNSSQDSDLPDIDDFFSSALSNEEPIKTSQSFDPLGDVSSTSWEFF